MRHVGGCSRSKWIGRLVISAFFYSPLLFSTEAKPTSCKPFENYGNARLNNGPVSALWAQELVGAELARETVRNSGLAQVAKIGIMESGFHTQNISKAAQIDLKDDAFLSLPQVEGRYGDLLANLIFDSKVGVAGNAKFSAPASTGWPTAYNNLFEAAGVFLNNRPSVVAVTQDLGDDENVLAAWQRVAAQGTMVILAAGDGFPRPIRDVVAGLDGIRVGSISESGLMDMGSQEDVELDIAAPAGQSIQSLIQTESGPEWVPFGGTRAAAGLVVGAVANVVSLLPGVKLAEVRALMRITAQSTVNQREPVQRNGAGMLNAYKMAEVAGRLRNQGWPKNRKQISNLKSPIYDFKLQAEAFLSLARTLSHRKDCKLAKRRISLLRSVYLLTGSEETRRGLELEYRRAGFERTAHFLATMSAHYGELIKAAMQEGQPRDVRLAALRAAGNLGLDKSPLRVLEQEAQWLDSVGPRGEEVQNRLLIAMAVSRHPNLNHMKLPKLKESVLVKLLGMASTVGRREFVLKFSNALRPAALDISAAVAAGQTEIVEMLLAKGAPVDGIDSRPGRTPLTYAMNLRWNYAVARLLLERGANVNQLTATGGTALTAAITLRDDRMVGLLLDKQADPMLGKQRGRNAVELAYAQQNKHVVELLCRHRVSSDICRQVEERPGTSERLVAEN